MAKPNYEIYIRDRNLQRIGIVSQYRKLDLIWRFNDVGAWQLDMPDNDTSGANLLKRVRAQGGGLGGIVVFRDGVPIFSGPIHGLEASANYQDDATSENISFWGTDDNGLLAMRLAMPPTPLGTYQAWAGTGIDYYNKTDKAESILIDLVTKNCIDSPPRKIVGLLTDADHARGNTITIKARYHPLLEKLQEAATAGGGLGFKTIQRQAGQITFEVFVPSDKTNRVVFSKDLGNLSGYKYKVEKPTTNFVIVGGGGEDVARTFRYAGDEPSRSLYGTWEAFVDQRQTTDVDELNQALYTTIRDQTETIAVELHPLDVGATRYWTDYELGDTVTAAISGERISDIVQSVEISVTPDQGETITPTIGTAGVGTIFRLFDPYRNLESRLINLETI